MFKSFREEVRLPITILGKQKLDYMFFSFVVLFSQFEILYVQVKLEAGSNYLASLH